MGTGRGRVRVTPGGVVSPSERDPWRPSEKGRRSSSPAYARPLAQAPFYFESSGRVFFYLGTPVPRQDPPPPCCHQGPAPGRGPAGDTGAALGGKAGQRRLQQSRGSGNPDSVNPAHCCALRFLPSCALGLGLGVLGSLGFKRRELHWNLHSKLRALRPWLWGPSAGLCPSSRLCSPHRVALAGISISAT